MMRNAMRRIIIARAVVLGFLTLAVFATDESLADGPEDNVPTAVRLVPPVGIELPQTVQEELANQARQIRIAVANSKSASDADQAEVLVFARAIELALEYSTLYSDAEINQARDLANVALERVANGNNWLHDVIQSDPQTQAKEASPKPRLVVGGFRSKIDGSIQPYGLVLPASLKLDDTTPLRLDVWLHGRGEKVCEVQFLSQRSKQVGEIAPENTIVLHPFGRYSNAFKFAGEIDVLEAIDHVKKLFPIDMNRINIRGFSMGGAGCWQLAVHYPGTWMAATPGAGFCETREFLKGFQQEDFVPTAFQEPLLNWYDCPQWGNNLCHLPTIAYSGELDKQKQAADLMERTLQDRGIKLTHLIGPETAHKLHPESKTEIEKRLTELAATASNRFPLEVDFTTYTLRYHQCDWVSIEGLEEHWQEARVQAKFETFDLLRVSTKNVSRLAIGPLDDNALTQLKSLVVDSQELAKPLNAAATIYLIKREDKWAFDEIETQGELLRKRPGLQGPIDDAFMSPFVFVTPNDVQKPSLVDRWVASEYKHATGEWRRHFRGDVVAKSVSEISADDKLNKNLILFGTPQSNPLIAEVLQRMPIAWTRTMLAADLRKHSPDKSVLIAIYPSPFATDRYVVINSGFTFREYAYLNNARQVPMLPDWAVIDVTDGATTQMPGNVVEAGFFDEFWGLRKIRIGGR